jgi:3-methyl-2-oxobutanoate hydroxymethyltransferase
MDTTMRRVCSRWQLLEHWRYLRGLGERAAAPRDWQPGRNQFRYLIRGQSPNHFAPNRGYCTKQAGNSENHLRRITIRDIQRMHEERVPICMVTAYSYPQALHADLAAVDIVLVGDSLAMVELGHDTTQFVTLDDVLHHCRAVARGCRRALLLADMPFGTCETSTADALRNVTRMIQEGHAHGVKIEGGKRMAPVIEACVHSLGVAVMGHVGLRPQSYSARGGFRAFGTNASEAAELLEDALALQEAGAFALVLECVPARLATAVTTALRIPTIGIGAGGGTSGQVLVYHDLCGMMTHPHHVKVTPKFCKRFAEAGAEIHRGLVDYRTAVKQRRFPTASYAPYQLPDAEWERFGRLFEQLTGQGLQSISAPEDAQTERLDPKHPLSKDTSTDETEYLYRS